ncbi:MAG: hypothetical protein J1F11_11115 [Oscillospiraceae bacterium]|nr:hypothetical protein [Oscillospiraceae bacterium]
MSAALTAVAAVWQYALCPLTSCAAVAESVRVLCRLSVTVVWFFKVIDTNFFRYACA